MYIEIRYNTSAQSQACFYILTLKNIENFLPVLSEKGSRDDMSLAGIVNLDALQNGLEEQEIRDEIGKVELQLHDLQRQENEIKTRIDEAYTEEKALWESKSDN